MFLRHTGIIALSLLSGAYGQCLNQVAQYNPNVRTMSENNTWFLIPVSKTAVQSALDASYGKTLTGQSNVQLLPIPSSDRTLFPNGWPSDKHLVVASSGLNADIRMAQFQIDGPLLGGRVNVPFVKRYDSAPTTVLQAQLNGYLAGPGNTQLSVLVPNTVSTFIEGYAERLGQFGPDDAAYMYGQGIYENKLAWTVAPNPVTGPGVYIEAFDFQYLSGKLKTTTLKLFKYVLNQPSILTGAVGVLSQTQCQRNQNYFNNDTSTIITRVGNVTLGPSADGIAIQTTGILQKASPDGSGLFTKVEGFSACGQNVGFNPENCDAASQNVDKSSL